MKNGIVLLATWLFITGSALAKGPVWNRGELQLVNGTVLDGDLSYNWKAEIIQFRQGDAIKAYSAHQIESFRFFDDHLNTIRKFVAFDYPVKPTLHRPIFLEQCITGTLTVYRRLRHLRDPIPVVTPSAYRTDEALLDDIDNFTYYVVDANNVLNLDGFLRNLWPRLRDEFGDELQRYAGSLHMDLNNTLARLLLINQYNTLKLIAAQTAPAEASTVSIGH